MSLDSETSAKAFGLVILAGSATAIGAAVVFVPSLVKLANHKTLAASLGLSAGVMLYVSLVDIYNKSIGGFQAAGHDEGKAFIYTTLSYFGGMVIMKVVHVGVHYLLSLDSSHKKNESAPSTAVAAGNSSSGNLITAETAGAYCHDEEQDPVQALDDIHQMAENVITQIEIDSETETDLESATEQEVVKKKLFTMGAATAIAIALHNFPEGLMTFVTYVEEPAVGIALAVGIAIHNIPEGLCVAMPIFYATGSRWKGFLWGILSGASEPVGALIGWLVLKNDFSGNTYGIMFGLVAGIMVFLVVDELLPTAHKHDPTSSVTTPAVFCGMLLLAVSLMLFSV